MLKRNAPSRQGHGCLAIRPSSTSSNQDNQGEEECSLTANSKRLSTTATASGVVVGRGHSNPTGLAKRIRTSAGNAALGLPATKFQPLSSYATKVAIRRTSTASVRGEHQVASMGTKRARTDESRRTQSENHSKEKPREGIKLGGEVSGVKCSVQETSVSRISLQCSGTARNTPTKCGKPSRKVKTEVGERQKRSGTSSSQHDGVTNDENKDENSRVPSNRKAESMPVGNTRTSTSAVAGRKGSIRRKMEIVHGSNGFATAGDATTEQQQRHLSGRSTNGQAVRTSTTTSSARRATSAPKTSLSTPGISSTVTDCKDGTEPATRRESLPPSPFPGYKNVSWTCLACGGARHHLTSRSAMEPLRKSHGFKVHRVPNDGDCFYSSVKAALEGSLDFPVKGKDGEKLTVAQMRKWVADETGEEQLAFYILQAKANPQDRWLDFVRPLDERLSSDDEGDSEENEEGEGDEGTSYAGDESSSRSTPPSSARHGTGRREEADKVIAGRSIEGDADVEKAEASNRKSRRRDSVLKGNDHGSLKRDPNSKGGAIGCKVLASKLSTEESPPRENPSPAEHLPQTSQSALHGETSKGAVGSGRRVGVRRSTRMRRSGVTSSRCEAMSESETATKSGREHPSPSEVFEVQGEEHGGLPVVRSVEELRQFVRLEGSVVGHGGCMWADTFAHHVISRRLGLTILFVDMERDKEAWPYRILARSAEKIGSEDERFVVLKREPNHFVLIKVAPLGLASAIKRVNGGSSGKHDIPALTKIPKGGLSCFRRSELPDVVLKLWRIETLSEPGKGCLR